ncbi:MAG: glycosyltransferase [Marinicaulis sp.]|nr:glycosyltransferase [Marinicaulis sp.]NNL88067.1 glycosyltransferase [Marinicaulis sp.]
MANRIENFAIVAIGRNEGERLVRCLAALCKVSDQIVYVDSDSTDESIEIARAAGVEILSLDASEKFTAARARNAGVAFAATKWPAADLIFFIDGDCELADGFLEAASKAFESDNEIGIVTGRCRELFPDATIYNRLCDLEWDGPIGDIEACGGIFSVRKAIFDKAGGFDPEIIAAEDDEFCIRVRQTGSRIVRIAHEMCFHDANITRFGQWWRRAYRAGYAFAQVGDMHEGYFRRSRRRALLWGLILPAVAIAIAFFTNGLGLGLLALYLLSFLRNRRNLIKDGKSKSNATIYSLFLTISKFPNLLGMADYWRKRLLGQTVRIVEYK